MGDEHQDEGEPEDIHPVVLMVQPGDGNLDNDNENDEDEDNDGNDDGEDGEEDENNVSVPVVEDDLGRNSILMSGIFWIIMVCSNRLTIEASPIRELTASYIFNLLTVNSNSLMNFLEQNSYRYLQI